MSSPTSRRAASSRASRSHHPPAHAPPLTGVALLLSLAASFDKHQLREAVKALQVRLADDLAAKPPLGCPIASLAKVELQLIMRCCDRVSLITLARCSRTTLAAASSDFAWRCLSPIRICSSTPQLAHKLSTSLLRHVDVCLWLHVAEGDVWRHEDSFFTVPRISDGHKSLRDAELTSITAVTRLRGIDFSRRSLDSEDQERLLKHPACAQLTELHFESGLSAELLCTIAQRQPLLHTLSLRMHKRCYTDVPSLVQLQHLTQLRVHHDCSREELSLSPLRACPSLRTLSLIDSCDTWPSLLSAPSLQSLESLELHDVDFDSKSRDLWAAWLAAFANLRALKTVLISRCWSVDEFLWTLAAQRTSSVHSLRVHADSWGNRPHAEYLRHCLLQLPAMHLQLEMRRPELCDASDRDHWNAIHASYTQLAQEFGRRMVYSTLVAEVF